MNTNQGQGSILGATLDVSKKHSMLLVYENGFEQEIHNIIEVRHYLNFPYRADVYTHNGDVYNVNTYTLILVYHYNTISEDYDDEVVNDKKK